MSNKKRAANATPSTDSTKVDNSKDITKVFEFFQYTTGTTLDCMLATGVLRNSITWYVRDLERMGELQAVCRKKDVHTRRLAKYYSANKDEWKPSKYVQLNIFGEEVAHGV
ncbi:MAG: hypothetical protein ACOYJK_10885 [Prevotella sp.]|jgi:hypothetical protein